MYLGIDLGTSSVKALLIDDAQRIVASGSSLAMNASGMGPATGLPRPQYVAMSDVN